MAALSDPLGDMLTRIRNGQTAGKAVVRSPASKLRSRVLDVLQAEGYIRGWKQVDDDAGHASIEIELKYHEGLPVIQSIDRISRPGRRVYSAIKDLRQFRNGLGIQILSTPRGVMSDASARAANVGGEVLCRVF